MSPTRRHVLLGGAAGLTALAGCSALSDPQQSLVVAVNNYTDARYQGHVRIETDDTVLVNQYLDVAPAEPDGWATVESKVDLGALSSDTQLDVTASFGDGLTAQGQHDLDCTDQYAGRAVYVQIENETPVNVRLNLACYDEFPTNEAGQGSIDHP